MKKKNTKTLLVGVLFFCMLLSLYSSNFNTVQAETTEEDPVIFNMGGQQMSSLTTLDPIIYQMWPEMDVIFMVTEGLTTWVTHADGTTSIDPCLAKSWNFEDNLTLNVQLREGASFTDGTPWNSTSCKWNWDRLANLFGYSSFAGVLSLPADPFRNQSGVGNLTWVPTGGYVYVINSTEAVSEYEVSFHLNVPFDLLNIVGPHIRMISPTTMAAYQDQYMPCTWLGDDLADVLALGLVGTGPYTLDEINFDEETTTLLKNPNWWGQEGVIDILNFRYYSGGSETGSLALVSGEIDGLSYVDEEIVQDKSNLVYLEEPQVGVGQLIALLPEKIDAPVREALNYAFNSQYFIDEVLDGAGVLPPGAVFYQQTFSNDSVHPPRFNLAEAKQILIDSGVAPSEASGWTDQEWTDVADGDGSVGPLGNYTLGYMDNYGMLDWSVSMQAAARTIGINVTLAIESEATYFTTIFDRGAVSAKYDMFCGTMGMGSAVELTFLMMYTSSSYYGLSMPIGGDSQVDEAIWNFMTASPDDIETKQFYVDQAADRINNELFCYAWMPVANFQCAHSNEWTNVSSLIDVRPWQWVPASPDGDDTDDDRITIPGFSLTILGISAAMVVAAIIKKRK